MAITTKIFEYVWDILYPKSCVVCGRMGEWVCADDQRLLVAHPVFECPYCHRAQNGVSVCSQCQNVAVVTKLWVVARYHNPVIEPLIQLLKYEYVTDLLTDIKKLLVSYKSQIKDWDASISLVPVPLYWRKECERGFNQALLIARAAQEVFGNPVLTDVLERVQNHSPQARLNAEERRRNVQGGFRIKNMHLIPKRVILIDDVCTTGATMEACARALKSVGVEDVWGLVIARG